MDARERRSLPRVLGPDLLQRFAITRGQVRTELRRGTWQRLAAGTVLTRTDEPTRADWADVGVLLGGPDSALSGWDAVRARGIGERRPPSELVLVLSRSGMNRVVGGVRIRRTRRSFTATRAPLGGPYELTPLAPLARAAADTALDCRDLGTVRALLASAVQHRLCTVPDLLAEYAECPRNRSHFLREALADLRAGARSAAEATAARRLARGCVPPFELNVPIVDEFGVVVFVVDVLWRELRAALEIDSREFHFGLGEWEATLARHNQLTRYGLALTHYPPREITRRGSTFVPDVADWLHRRATEIGVPLPPGHGVRRPRLGTDPPPYLIRRSRAS